MRVSQSYNAIALQQKREVGNETSTPEPMTPARQSLASPVNIYSNMLLRIPTSTIKTSGRQR